MMANFMPSRTILAGGISTKNAMTPSVIIGLHWNGQTNRNLTKIDIYKPVGIFLQATVRFMLW